MIILFSPSESKNIHGEYGYINKNSFIFKELYEKRLYVINMYNNYINSNVAEDIVDIFGIKNLEEIKLYQHNMFESKTCIAIERYSGVSYSYLAYDKLNKSAKEYILNNVIIFSNLFGPISAKDRIPYYKLKQGAKVDSIVCADYYKKNFSASLDDYIHNEEVVDLRASFYEKFYRINKNYTTFKFIKNGKTVSHYSKAYRGIILKTMAENGVINAKNIIKYLPTNLEVVDIHTKGIKEEIVLNIL